MKLISILTATLMTTFFPACGGKDPQHNDVVGTWKNPDGATVTLIDNGEFTARSLPAEYVLLPRDSFRNQKFDGSGNWTLRKGQAQWEIYLDFNKFSDQKYACSFPLLISGEKGVLENTPPWQLFLWQEEEGGQRYTFNKK